MRPRNSRILLTGMIASAVVVGLAGSASGSIALAIDTNEGFTSSGAETTTFQQSTPTGPGTPITQTSPIGPTTVSGHQDAVALEWVKHRETRRPFCSPFFVPQITEETNRIVDEVVIHFLAEVNGQVESLQIVVGSFDSGGATVPLPIEDVQASAKVTSGPMLVAVPLAPIGPGMFEATLPSPLGVDGTARVDVSFRGRVEPPALVHTTFPLFCPFQPLFNTIADGSSRLVLRDTSVQLNLADVLVVRPENAKLAPGETQTFTAYNCPRDADGNPILGPDGEPATADDDCVPAAADWSVAGTFGTVSPQTGSSTTTLTGADLPPGVIATGQVVASFDGKTAAADVTVESPLIPFVSFDPSGLSIKVFNNIDRVKVTGTFEFAAGQTIDPTTQPVSITLARPGEFAFWPALGQPGTLFAEVAPGVYSLTKEGKAATGFNAFDIFQSPFGSNRAEFNLVDQDALASGDFSQVVVDLRIGKNRGEIRLSMVEDPPGSGNWIPL